MIVLYIIGGLLALIILLLCIPLGVSAEYAQELSLTLRYLFIPIKILPQRDKAQPPSPFAQWITRSKQRLALVISRLKAWLKRAWQTISQAVKRLWERLFGPIKRRKRKRKTAEQPEPEEKKGFALLVEQRGFLGAVGMLLQVTKIALGRFGRILRGVRIQRLEVRASIGGEDAAQAAINYGRWCAVLFPALSLILEMARGRKRRYIRIDPNFVSEDNTITFSIEAYIIPILVVWHALAALVIILIDELKRQIAKSKAEAAQSMAAAVNNDTNNSSKGGATNV